MKYIVMECHYSYAIVLSEDGQFFKVANLHYEVGQTIDEIIKMKEPEGDIIPVSKKKSPRKWITSIATMAACMVIVLTSFFHMNQSPYASVYMTINPEVRIDINKKDLVVGLEGINEDGVHLIEDYSYKKKDLNLVMDELVDRAITMGYLSDGDQISLTLDGDNNEWVVSRGNDLNTHLNEYLKDKMSVTITVDVTEEQNQGETKKEETSTKRENQTIVIPVTPDDDSNYGDSSYETSSSKESTTKPQNSKNNANDSGYDNDDGASGYDDSDDNNASGYDDSDDNSSDNNDSDDTESNSANDSDNDNSTEADDDNSDDTASNYDDNSNDAASNYNDDSDDAASNYDDDSDDAVTNYNESDSAYDN